MSRWTGIAVAGLAVLFALFGVWLTQASDRVVGFDTHRNDHDLRILADRLASWPATIESMAEKNFIPQRLEAADPVLRRGGWQAQARFWHPEIGRFVIRYALAADDAACPQRSDARGAWFDAYRLNLRGSLDAASLEAADRAVVPGLGDWRAWLGAALPLPAGATRLCYAAELPLAGLTRLAETAPRIAQLLIADARGHVAAQLGDDPLPIADLAQLRAVTPLSGALIGAMPGAPRTAAAPRSLDPLAAVRVSAGGRDYDAYLRDIALPGTGEAARAQAVALVPTGRLLERVPRAPIILAGFAIPLLLLLALTAVLKLRLIGPGDGLAKLEVAALGLGLAAATALATAATAFAVDVELSRARAGVRTADTVIELRRQFAAEVAPLLGLDAGLDRRARWADPAACLRTPLPLASVFGETVAGYPLREARRTEFDVLRLPPRESVFVVGRDGRLLPGSAISACRINNGGRLDVATRDYFTRALEGDTTPLATRAAPRWARLRAPGAAGLLLAAPAYTIEQVRSQSDGIDKTLVAFPAIASPRALAAKEPDAVVVEAAVLRTLLAPVLPMGVRFMVVDLASPGLEVLFHSDRERVHFERAARELRSPKLAGVLTGLAAPGAETDGPPALTSTYDGARQHFGLARLPFANWAVLAWHAHDGADRIPTQTLFATLMTFSALATVLGGVPLLVLGVLGRLRWRWLWPDARRERDYRRLAAALALVAALSAAGIVLWPGGPLWATLFCWAGGWVATRLILAAPPSHPPGPLTPATARSYTRAALAALVALIVVPLLGVHADASRFGQRSLDADAQVALATGLAARARATAAISNVYFSDLRTARQRALPPGDLRGVAAGCWRPLAAADADDGLAQRLFHGLYHGPTPRAAPVTPALLPLACPGATLTPGGRATFAEPAIHWESGSLTRLAYVLVVAGLGLAVVAAALTTVTRRLFGLATPLEAVIYPPLASAADYSALDLPPKILIVGAPLGLRAKLLDDGHRVDLAAETLGLAPGPGVAAPWQPPVRYVLDNLELTLREPERRRAALRFIETLAARPDVGDGRATLVLLAGATPLERLLQAYENEKRAAADDAATDLEAVRRHREDIRWARLLEDFRTFIFAPVDKLIVRPRDADDPVAAAVLAEVRGLPEHVIATLLPQAAQVPPAPRPLTAAEYDAAYRAPVLALARDLHAASPAAAVDFIGLLLIEHYQQLWSASSRAEQLVLYNLSVGRVPSMAAVDALKSLIRRGLVRFDPAPRLFNASFAGFVRHAEPPQTLRRWRADAPKGGWRFAVWPLLIVLPLGLLALGGAILDSGQPLVALLPLLVATGPALLQTLGVFRKAST